ncbi:helix-turn-helix domain-containing protein [Pontibacillus marinus]|uniref:HTH cro/C1-type domain-containing protein n=1 Tax=Pontibacillus marinus BH030004 = DSM 16465 TaxID=1385511 RepID=A0A0A5I621_9BACI|nr:helix-turn-helix domain-containing protein [Pontibacillus marinus]KGX91277.1 hypothetical protein N783_11255 [Pontibacillus marinus BH030004 = DSM 16465]
MKEFPYDKHRIGMVIKSLRQERGMTQKELCHDICTQSNYVRIEKGDTEPTLNILYLLVSRLGIKFETFLKMTRSESIEYAEDTIDEIVRLIRLQRHQEAYELIKKGKNNPAIKNTPEYLQVLMWHESTCLVRVNQSPEEGIALAKEALSLSPSPYHYTETEINILNSIACFYHDIGQVEEANQYFHQAEDAYERLTRPKDEKVLIRILINWAANNQIVDPKTSLKKYKQGIEICIKNNQMYCLGQLYMGAGDLYTLSKEKDLALDYNKKALHVFEIQNNPKFDYMMKAIQEQIDLLNKGIFSEQMNPNEERKRKFANKERK